MTSRVLLLNATFEPLAVVTAKRAVLLMLSGKAELVQAAQRSMAKLLPLVETEERAVTLWSRAHGHVSLEIEGNFASMGLDPEALYAETIRTG